MPVQLRVLERVPVRVRDCEREGAWEAEEDNDCGVTVRDAEPVLECVCVIDCAATQATRVTWIKKPQQVIRAGQCYAR